MEFNVQCVYHILFLRNLVDSKKIQALVEVDVCLSLKCNVQLVGPTRIELADIIKNTDTNSLYIQLQLKWFAKLLTA